VSRLQLQSRRFRDLAARWLSPGEVAEHWNEWNLYREIAWYGVLSGVNATFISVFALRLGASNLLIGLLTSLPALINVLFQIPAARFVEREQDRRRVLLLSGFLMRLPAFVVALAPLLPAPLQAGAVVNITALGTIPAAVGTLSFTSILADVVAPQHRARVVSVRNALLSAATTIAVLAAGRALEVLPFPFSYQLVFTLAFAASLISLYYLGRIAVPHGDARRRQRTPRAERLDVRRALRMAASQRDYLRFTLGAFVYHWGLYFPIPLYSIYRVRTLQLSDGWIGALAMLESATTITAYFLWGRLAQRRGSRLVVLCGTLLVCFYPVGMALSRSAWPLLIVVFVAGIAGPAMNLGLFNGLLEAAPAERRASYVGLFNTLMNTAAFISPLLGTAAAGALGIRTALWIGGAMRIGGFAAFAFLLLARRNGLALATGRARRKQA
jgi:MFS family permease